MVHVWFRRLLYQIDTHIIQKFSHPVCIALKPPLLQVLKLDSVWLSKTEPGQVINLMSNDVNRFDQIVLFLHYLWVMPVVVPVVCYLLWQKIQWATLAALGVICFQTVFVQG